jgi:hypothetical protein
MAAFSISEAAAREIRRKIEFSEIEEPIASLLDSSQSFSPSAEMLDAITRNASDEEMRELAMKEQLDRAPFLKMHLEVGIYDLEEVPPEYRVEIDGFRFSMAQAMVDHLMDHVLDHDNGAFVLRHGQRVYPSLVEWAKGLESAV